MDKWILNKDGTVSFYDTRSQNYKPLKWATHKEGVISFDLKASEWDGVNCSNNRPLLFGPDGKTLLPRSSTVVLKSGIIEFFPE